MPVLRAARKRDGVSSSGEQRQSGKNMVVDNAAASDLCGRLSKKIRSQAGQLADLTERLQQQEAYSRLVETRLLELDPEHALPVTPCQVSRCMSSGSNSRRKRAPLQSSPSTLGDSQRRQDDSALGVHKDDDMRKGYLAAQQRLRDAAKLIRKLREALTTRDADARAATERARKFQRDASDLRRRIDSNSGRSGHHGGGDKKREQGPAAWEDLSADSRREIAQLKGQLQQQRDACLEAREEGDGLRDMLQRTRSADTSTGKCGAGTLAKPVPSRSSERDVINEAGRLQRQLPISHEGICEGSRYGVRNVSGDRNHGNGLHDAGTPCSPRLKVCECCAVGGGQHQSETHNVHATDDKPGLEAEKEALLDHVKELLERIQGLEVALAAVERQRSETSLLAEGFQKRLTDADSNAGEMRRNITQKECELSKVREQLTRLGRVGEADRAEKDEMGRMYSELLKQLRLAEEAKEKVHLEASQAINREQAAGEAVGALREQLDQSLRRLADAQDAAMEKTRHLDKESNTLKTALSRADSRLAKLDALEADVSRKTQELERCREESFAMKNDLLHANSRFARLDALEVEVKARTEEVRECRKQNSSNEEHVAKEQDRTLRLIGTLDEMQTEAAILKSREKSEASRAENLERQVSELTFLCEELQKRVASLQSGEEVEGLQRHAQDAFGLAERQDELLEDASVSMEKLKTEGRYFKAQMIRLGEQSSTAKKILATVLAVTQSRLRIESMDAYHRHAVENGQAHPHLWETEEPTKREQEVPLEGLAKMVADSVTSLLIQCQCGTAQGAVSAERWAGSGDKAGIYSCVSPRDRPPVPGDPEGWLRASSLRTSRDGVRAAVRPLNESAENGMPKSGSGTASGEAINASGHLSCLNSSADREAKSMSTVTPMAERRHLGVSWDTGKRKSSRSERECVKTRVGADVRNFSSDGFNFGLNSRLGEGQKQDGLWGHAQLGMLDRGAMRADLRDKSDRVGAYDEDVRRTSRNHACGGMMNATDGDGCGNIATTQRRRRDSSGRGAKPAATTLSNDLDSLKRMEGIRRRVEGDVSPLVGGVKSARRGYLEGGGRPSVTFKENCWTPLNSQSPSTRKIKQRIRVAQDTLRSLRDSGTHGTC